MGKATSSRLGWVVLSVCVFVSASACAPAAITGAQIDNDSRMIYGLTFEPSGFDPHINASSELGIPLRQVYDTLVYRDPSNGAFVPGLATEWALSPDERVYTFRLRQGVTFHDGTPFNAQAVAANLVRITNPDNASQKAVFMLGSYTSHRVIDDFTIELILAEPYSPLLDSLSQVYLGIASPTALAAYSNERYQYHQVGTGVFTFVEYIPGDRLVLRRNPATTWSPSFYVSPPANGVNEIEFRFFSDPLSRTIALEGQDADVMGEIAPADARVLGATDDLTLLPVPIPGQPLQFLLNTAQYPTDNLLVRQALLFGTNREIIVDSIFQGYSPVAWGPLAANTPFYNRQVVGAYAFDAVQARVLLEQAGFEDADNNGYYDGREGGDLEVVVIVPSWGFVPEVAQLLQDQWRAIGVRGVLQPAPTRSLVVERVNEGAYNLVAFYSFGADPSLLNEYFLSNGATNWSRYSSTDLDNLLTTGVRQSTPDARSAVYAQAQRIIMEQALILPIRDYVNLNAARVGVQNLSFDAYGWFPLLYNTTVAAP